MLQPVKHTMPFNAVEGFSIQGGEDEQLLVPQSAQLRVPQSTSIQDPRSIAAPAYEVELNSPEFVPTGSPATVHLAMPIPTHTLTFQARANQVAAFG